MPEIYRTPDERFADLPGYSYAPHYAEIEGLRMHYLDEGTGSPVICFHGEPTWSYLYRKMIGPLTDAGHRVVCPDLVGFGRSDKPTELGWYSYDRHVEHVSGLLDQVHGLEDVTVVVQDWGGPIGLRWAMEHADRVGALVILNTGLFTGRVSNGFMQWRAFAEKVGTELPVGTIVQGATFTEVPEDVVAAYEAPFPGPEAKAGAATFPLLVPLKADAPGAAKMRAVTDWLGTWDKPALVAFSDSDPVFPFPRAGQTFVDVLPTVEEQVKITGGAHFLQEDCGEEIAAHIIALR